MTAVPTFFPLFLSGDGGSFAGALAEPINGLYFRGAAIFDESVRRLLALGMSSAKNIILKGCSAGGLATYVRSLVVLTTPHPHTRTHPLPSPVARGLFS